MKNATNMYTPVTTTVYNSVVRQSLWWKVAVMFEIIANITTNHILLKTRILRLHFTVSVELQLLVVGCKSCRFTNFNPILHRFWVIAEYWSNYRISQEVPPINALILVESMNSRLWNLAWRLKKLETPLYRKTWIYFDISNRFGVAQQCDRRTEWLLAIAPSNDII